MKTSFKPHRGSVWHVVHETKTGAARVSCHTLCGAHFERGERGNHAPTCPECLTRDNPLTLHSDELLRFIAFVLEGRLPPPQNKSRLWLEKRDLINPAGALTRRGAVLAEDLAMGPVPAADVAGVMHARLPLSSAPKCMPGAIVGGLTGMTVSRYEKLRRAHEDRPVPVTCILCAGST